VEFFFSGEKRENSITQGKKQKATHTLSPPSTINHSALGFEPAADEVRSMVSSVDKDGSGLVDYDDFVALMAAKVAARDPLEELRKAFRLFDDDETGKISFANLKRVARELGEALSDEELQEMIDEADRDGDGEVDVEEFLRIMQKTALF
jgi:centrin-1